MNWYYIDGPLRVGPLNETEWVELLRTGKIQPDTLVWHEGMDHRWLPVSQLPPPPPEEKPWEAPQDEPAPPQAEIPEAFAARVADLDYPVNLDHCLSRAWQAFKSGFWMLVGSTLLIGVLIGVGSQLPILEYLIPMLLHGVLMGGLYLVYLRIMRGEQVAIADLFAGFDRTLLKPLALKTLLNAMVWQLCLVPGFIAMKMMGFDLQDLQSEAALAKFAADPQASLVLALVFLTGMIPAVYFSFCWMFSIPLIVDKRMDFWPAMQLSRHKVLQHPWRVSWLVIVAGLLGFSGILGFVIGIFFTLPLYSLIFLYLYEDMFNVGSK